MQRGRVSVMMPAYNAAAYIAEAIGSVLAQSYRDWELLIVDDGSTDATAEIAGGFRDPRIRLLHKENGGESSARNLALEHSTGEFIAYLDADDAWLSGHLAAAVGFLGAHPDRGAVYTDGYHIDENGRRLASLQSRRRGPFEGRVFEQVVLASDVFGPPSSVVLRHEVIARHRLRYDTRIVIGPDWDFFVRYSDLGTFGYLTDRTCLYRVHRSNITARVDRGRRAGFLAICRENAIRLPGFATCSAATRTAVFYDLMVNLLEGQTDRQAEVARWGEFSDLPRAAQGRLLRRIASESIVNGGDGHRHEGAWLRQARALDPGDLRAQLLSGLYRLSPRMCRALLRAKSPFREGHRDIAPFADLMRAE